MIIQNKNFPDGELVINTDYSHSSHAGADGCFQIVNISININGDTDESIIDQLQIDYGKHYFSILDVLKDLDVNPKEITYREE